MTTITKKELVNRIADRTGQTKVVTKEIIQLFLDEIINELAQGNRLEFRDFGVFEVKFRKARRAQNPRTLEKVHVPPKKVVKFKVGRVMREKVGEQGSDEGAEGSDDAAPPSPTPTTPGSPSPTSPSPTEPPAGGGAPFGS